MIRFLCPKCDTNLKSADDKAGTKTTCPRCGERLEVPAGGGAKADAKTNPKGGAVRGTKKGPIRKGDAKANKGGKMNLPILIGGGLAVVALVAVALVFLMPSLFSDKPGTNAKPVDTQVSANPTTAPPVLTNQPPVTTAKEQVTKATKPEESVKKPEEVTEAKDLEAGKMTSGVASLGGEQIYQKLLKSTVWIFCTNNTTANTGSGSLIDRKNKLVLTNYHVVRDGEKGKILAFFPQYERGELISDKEFYTNEVRRGETGIPCFIELMDSSKDLAIIRLAELPEGVQQIRIAKNSGRPGQQVFSFGSPGASTSLWNFTAGAVRGTPGHRKYATGGGGGGKESSFIVDAQVVETTNPINPGDSGGPLVNDRAEIVAVVQATKTGANLVNVFIDISEVRKFLARVYKEKNWTLPSEMESQAISTVESTDISQLIKNLDTTKDSITRAKAAQQLGQIGPDAKSAIPLLVKALKDKEESVRKSAADALEQIGSLTQADVPILMEVIVKDTNPDIRLAAINSIKQMKEEADSAVPALVKALKDSDQRVRLQSARTITQLGSLAAKEKETIPALAKALKEDKNSDVRSEVALAIGKMGSDGISVMPALEEALKDTSKDVKINILIAVENLGSDAKGLIPALIKALKAKDMDIRHHAISALGAMGSDAKAAVDDLIKEMEEKDLRVDASKALVRIGKDTIKPLSKVLLNTRSHDVQLGAVEALGEIGPDAISAVSSLMLVERRSVFPDVREAATAAIKKIRVK